MWEGKDIVRTGRIMLGETNPFDSKPGTIRGDFCIEIGRLVWAEAEVFVSLHTLGGEKMSKSKITPSP